MSGGETIFLSLPPLLYDTCKFLPEKEK